MSAPRQSDRRLDRGRLSQRSIENSWHWPRDVVMAEDRHRYRERNGVQVLAALRTIAMNLLRLKGFQSLTQGRDALAHDLHALLNLS